MENYLVSTDIIDFDHPNVGAKARKLADGFKNDIDIAKRCYEFVRDEIRHTGDMREKITTCRASEVLEHGTGWCYAKSHLLAALLRANAIPTALCYQCLSINDDGMPPFRLHGLNAVHLENFGWYRIDARGNKAGVDAQFDPPYEKLAFVLNGNEFDLHEYFADPPEAVLYALKSRKIVAKWPMTQNQEKEPAWR
ncbi:MAG: Cro/Cl family transcriptional regulator [Sulfuricurvum sp. MLSB]|uniref:transglutaminase-like domain-containing protein n=1 Tax=unclassified Sulfuricurvum TaxID=2632390 RepID=UPI0005010FB3|nr:MULTISPECIES: transglutaminase family protein [unclassified Sulfuricurvum]KFN38750.1 MAG: Cro/Cl family transcriptional regulator [Sulfuricurvum sp. MLSB]